MGKDLADIANNGGMTGHGRLADQVQLRCLPRSCPRDAVDDAVASASGGKRARRSDGRLATLPPRGRRRRPDGSWRWPARKPGLCGSGRPGAQAGLPCRQRMSPPALQPTQRGPRQAGYAAGRYAASSSPGALRRSPRAWSRSSSCSPSAQATLRRTDGPAAGPS